jgi:hypothetical protein
MHVHAANIVVARMIDGAKPQPAQTLKPEGVEKLWFHPAIAACGLSFARPFAKLPGDISQHNF